MGKIAKLLSLAVRSFLLDGKYPSRDSVRMVTGESKKPAPNVDVLVDTFYPPIADGVVIVSAERIIKANDDLIDMTVRELGLTDIHRANFNPANLSDYNKIYNSQTLVINVIANFLSYVHLLPASENHHHAAVGGLARHSLEVALFSLRHMASVDIKETKFTDELHSKKIRWYYASWVVGLVHDIGKSLHDMSVRCGDSVWNPQIENIFEWAARCKAQRYEVTWNYADRHGKHIGLASSMLNQILTKEAKQYLFNTQDDLQVIIYETLSGSMEINNPIKAGLKKAEARSVHKDMLWQWDRLTGARKMPLEAAFIKRLQMLRRMWKTNEEKADIWCLGAEDVYVSYPSSFNKVMASLQADGYSVPMQVGKMLEMLVDRQLFEPLFEDYTTGHLWPESIGNAQVGPIKVAKPKWAGIVYGEDISPRGGHGRISLTRDDSLMIHYAPTGLISLTDTRKTKEDEKLDANEEVAIETNTNNSASSIHHEPEQQAEKDKPADTEQGNDGVKAKAKTKAKPSTAPKGKAKSVNSEQNNTDTQAETSPETKKQATSNNDVSTKQSNEVPTPSCEDDLIPPAEALPKKPDHKGVVFKNFSAHNENEAAIKSPVAKAEIDSEIKPETALLPPSVESALPHTKTTMDILVDTLLSHTNIERHRMKVAKDILDLDVTVLPDIESSLDIAGLKVPDMIKALMDEKLFITDAETPRKIINVVKKVKVYQIKLTLEQSLRLTEESTSKEGDLAIHPSNTLMPGENISLIMPDIYPPHSAADNGSLEIEEETGNTHYQSESEYGNWDEYSSQSVTNNDEHCSEIRTQDDLVSQSVTNNDEHYGEIRTQDDLDTTPAFAGGSTSLQGLKNATGNTSPKAESKYDRALQSFIGWAMSSSGKAGIDHRQGQLRVQSFVLTAYAQEIELTNKDANYLKRQAGDSATIDTDAKQTVWMVFDTAGITYE
ncbi:MobH family relaxase [Shewanella glacialipiscicola]|uniref:MobH family relaxase n=1 Tax=Shewanella glacialipiscicola TaxID=614069 RepID=UPI003D7AF70B